MTKHESNAIAKVTRYYIRHYRDNGQTTAYCDAETVGGWGIRIEGAIQPCFPHTLLDCEAHGCVAHMMALGRRAIREGLTIETEVW